MTDKDNSQTGEYSYTYSYSYSKEGGEKNVEVHTGGQRRQQRLGEHVQFLDGLGPQPQQALHAAQRQHRNGRRPGHGQKTAHGALRGAKHSIRRPAQQHHP